MLDDLLIHTEADPKGGDQGSDPGTGGKNPQSLGPDKKKPKKP